MTKECPSRDGRVTGLSIAASCREQFILLAASKAREGTRATLAPSDSSMMGVGMEIDKVFSRWAGRRKEIGGPLHRNGRSIQRG